MDTQEHDEKKTDAQKNWKINKKIEIVVYVMIAIWLIVLAALAYFTFIE